MTPLEVLDIVFVGHVEKGVEQQLIKHLQNERADRATKGVPTRRSLDMRRIYRLMGSRNGEPPVWREVKGTLDLSEEVEGEEG